jgi:hypothetical protein
MAARMNLSPTAHPEAWIYTADGWLTKRIEELKQGPTYLDGKLYEE